MQNAQYSELILVLYTLSKKCQHALQQKGITWPAQTIDKLKLVDRMNQFRIKESSIVVIKAQQILQNILNKTENSKSMNEAKQLQNMRKMALKNQQRCLNSQPFSRQRAYLSKQKCQQKIIVMRDDLKTLTKTNDLFDEHREKFDTQELKKLQSNPQKFDPSKILKQLDQVSLLIGAIQKKNTPIVPNRNQAKCKALTRHSTRTDSIQSPKSIESEHEINEKIQKIRHLMLKKQNKRAVRTEASARPKSQQSNSRQLNMRCTQDKKKMIKIKSSKAMIKVYNPFPTYMQDFI